MHKTSNRTLGAALALGLTFALTACGSSNSGGNARPTSAVASPSATVAATTAARASATSVAPVATLAANVTQTAATASTAVAAPTTAPTVAPTAKPGRGGATQDVLESLALKPTDLPPGFTPAPIRTANGVLADGQTGTYTGIFSKAPQGGGGGQAILLGLTAFADMRTASSNFKNSVDGAGARASALGARIEPVANDTALGDERAFLHQVSGGGATAADGYIIVFRRGTVGVLLSYTGTNGAGPQRIDDLLALAKLQDERLRAAGF